MPRSSASANATLSSAPGDRTRCGSPTRLAVELVGERPFPRGPRLREALIGDAPQQLRLGAHQLVELELVALLAAVVLEGPAAVLVALGSARVLEHPVHRHEFGDHHISHVIAPRWSSAFYLGPTDGARLIGGRWLTQLAAEPST